MANSIYQMCGLEHCKYQIDYDMATHEKIIVRSFTDKIIEGIENAQRLAGSKGEVESFEAYYDTIKFIKKKFKDEYGVDYDK